MTLLFELWLKTCFDTEHNPIHRTVCFGSIHFRRNSCWGYILSTLQYHLLSCPLNFLFVMHIWNYGYFCEVLDSIFLLNHKKVVIGWLWSFLLVGFTDETPRDYFCNLGPDGRRRDADERPELCRGTVEFVATKEYMVCFVTFIPPCKHLALEVFFWGPFGF